LARTFICSMSPWILAACFSQATAGKIMVASGGVLAGVGVLNAAGAFGGDCQNDPSGQLSCRSSGKPDDGSMAAIGIGSAVAATGAVLWALSSTKAEAHPVASPKPSPVANLPVVQSAQSHEVDPAVTRYAARSNAIQQQSTRP
jgi:hypothetical protein